MKRACPYCGLKFKGKNLHTHIYETHMGKGEEFRCRDDCVRCCTDIGAPLELVIGDVERIARALDISFEELFKEYGGIGWSNIPGTGALIPALGLPFPCGFLKEGKCTIYDIRPLHCRLFPERLYISPATEELEPFFLSGYACLDAGFSISEERIEEVKDLMEQDKNELIRTAKIFKNEEFIYELNPSQDETVWKRLVNIRPDDPERNRKRREIIESVIPAEFRDQVYEAFLDRLKMMDKK